MANYPVLSVLPVGQGNCNLIEVYSDPSYTKLIFLGMVDCGTDDIYKKRGIDGYVLNDNIVQAYDYIWKKMEQRGATCSPNKSYYLDVLLITHQDMDHWVLLEELFQYKVGKKITYANGNKLYSQYTGKGKSFCCYYGKSKSQYKWIYSEQNCISGIYCSLDVTITEERTGSSNRHMKVQIHQYDPKLKQYHCYDWDSCNIIMKHNVNGAWQSNVKISTIAKKIDKYKFPASYINYIPKNINQIGSFILDCMKNIKNNLDINITILPCINKVFIGGINFSDSFSDFLHAFKKKSPHYYLGVISNSCNILSIKQSSRIIYNIGNIKLELLCCLNISKITNIVGIMNDDIYSKITGSRNASSAVTCWTIDGYKYLFTGDATVHTMYYLNNNRNILLNYQGAVMTAPHHGSVTTSKGKLNSNHPDDYQVLGDFLKNAAPQAIVIGAGYNNSYHIPGKAFIDKSLAALKDKIDVDHYVYYYINSNDYILKTNQNIFSTVQAVKIFETYCVMNTQHTFKGLSHSHYLYDKILGYFDAYTTI